MLTLKELASTHERLGLYWAELAVDQDRYQQSEKHTGLAAHHFIVADALFARAALKGSRP